MNVSIAQLLEVLENLISIHQTMLELAAQKTPVLVNNQVVELNTIIHKENKLIKQIEELERMRVQLTGEYLISRGYNPDPKVRVSDLIKIIFKAEEKKALSEVQARLLDVMTEMKKQNEVNQKLIEQSLAFIDFSLDLFVKTPEQDAFYQHPNQSGYNSVRNGIFDTKA
ncbi:flagellar protein FlgN [Paenibacillus ferrarius]|uniref:flagellar protein FlgN n=1 Tax=Paenibacillus ferrarius TaxID=1469647 RepID=UPI0009A48693|nr:flagellar protein FlgN [Paenibacillus ferrarius]